MKKLKIFENDESVKDITEKLKENILSMASEFDESECVNKSKEWECEIEGMDVFIEVKISTEDNTKMTQIDYDSEPEVDGSVDVTIHSVDVNVYDKEGDELTKGKDYKFDEKTISKFVDKSFEESLNSH